MCLIRFQRCASLSLKRSPADFSAVRAVERATIIFDTVRLTMRLSQQTQQLIRETVHEVFGIEANVKLFGSRTNDDAQGGDIDLLVELPTITAKIEHKMIQLTARLQLRIGDQPIDVLVLDPLTPRQPIHEQAAMTGIAL
jgi:predicted nucleotidyltransferase